jgi:phenylpropionate dioxygenase-like ring-hydroxylating dioxygenase large terminal subunit
MAVDQKNSFLRNIWYYALPGEQIKPGQMLTKQLLGEPILFGRTTKGTVFALRDICPHRAVPLSCGRFNGQEIECAYHGWRFDREGKCTAIPALLDDRDVDLSLFRVRRYPVRESQGNIWIYMSQTDKGEVEEPQLEPPSIPGFADATAYQACVRMTFPCFIDHAVVGLMDPAHVPFVHRAWWWRADAILSAEVKTFDPSPYGFTMRRHRLERQTFFYRAIGGDAEVEISFQLPGVRIEQVYTNRHHVVNLTAITPISATETEVTTIFYTTLLWFAPLMPILSPFIRTFLNQDRDLVVKQQIGLQYDPPLMLINDADTQAKWYFQLRSEFMKSIEQNREFVNPIKSQVLRWRS